MQHEFNRAPISHLAITNIEVLLCALTICTDPLHNATVFIHRHEVFPNSNFSSQLAEALIFVKSSSSKVELLLFIWQIFLKYLLFNHHDIT